MGKEKGLRDFPIHKKNPYLAELVIDKRDKLIGRSAKNVSILNESTGELENTAFVGFRKSVDKEEFVKIYKSHIKSIFELSVAGIRLFGYFLNATKISNDMILFDVDECLEYTKYKSKNSINLGMSELLNNNFVAKSHLKNVYYINPAIFFNGNRMVVVTEYTYKAPKKTFKPK